MAELVEVPAPAGAAWCRLASRSLLTAAILAVLAGCTSSSNGGGGSTATSSAGSELMAARDKLISDVHQCSNRYGYDPNNVSGVADDSLAPQELPWRQCAYDAVRTYEKTNPALADRYEQLISEDIQMTTAIQQKAMTRSQRRARLEDLIAQIKSAEEAQASAATADQAQQMDQVRMVVDNMRGFAH